MGADAGGTEGLSRVTFVVLAAFWGGSPSRRPRTYVRMVRPLYALLALPYLCAPALLAAQPELPSTHRDVHRTPVQGELATLGINAALGGLSAGVLQQLRGGSFGRGFVAGAAGGAVAFAGKRLAVERFDGAGLLGRELHAVGASMVANAGEGRGALSRVALPLGPVRLHVGAGTRPALKLDLAAGVALAYGLAQADTRLDWGHTLSGGAPVFYTTPRRVGYEPTGQHSAGVIWVEADEVEWRARGNRVGTALAHERVHVLQHDFALAVVSTPLQRELAARVPRGERVGRHLELGLHFPIWRGLNEVVGYERRPWEREAFFLSNRTAGVDDGPVRAGER